MSRNVLDAVYGCLIGGAIGDALGVPAEGMYYQDVREKYGKVRGFIPYSSAYSSGKPGVVSDDTTLRHYMCLAIVRKGGRITPDDAARIWRRELNPDRFWSPDKIAYLKMKAGMSPWDAGRGSIPSACPAMAMVPIGIINAGNPAQAFQDGFNIAFINGDDFNRDAAATLAAGVASAFGPEATIDKVLRTMTDHSTYLVRRAIELTMDLAHSSDSIDTFTESFYDKMLDWWSRPSLGWTKERFPQGTGIETIPVVMAILYLCKEDVNQCIIEGASFGRDADTIASAAGAIAGAIHGASAIRENWIETVEKANEPFFEEVEGDSNANFRSMACRLVEALRSEMQATQERVNVLKEMLTYE